MKSTGAAISAPGLLFAVAGVVALLTPFMTLAANRIVAGEGVLAWNIAGPAAVAPGLIAVLGGLGLGLLQRPASLRLGGAVLGLGGLHWLLTQGASGLLAETGEYARVSPAVGFWVLLVVLMLLMADALTAMAPKPLMRGAILVAVLGALAVILGSGALSDLSVMQEYAGRSDAFAREAVRHLGLAFGSLAAAVVIGFPLGVIAHRRAALRSATLPVLSFLQTIPSLAMFGLMIPILGWVGATVPGARALGIAGIGFAPAFTALVLYSLLPVVGNTVAGLAAAPPAALEAARGMGMTPGQRLLRVELPLGLPIILTGLRIVLVQTSATIRICVIIGGGGFGTFVFQGLNQTATDLILLGALPTVVLALTAAIVMDILVDLTRRLPEDAT